MLVCNAAHMYVRLGYLCTSGARNVTQLHGVYPTTRVNGATGCLICTIRSNAIFGSKICTNLKTRWTKRNNKLSQKELINRARAVIQDNAVDQLWRVHVISAPIPRDLPRDSSVHLPLDAITARRRQQKRQYKHSFITPGVLPNKSIMFALSEQGLREAVGCWDLAVLGWSMRNRHHLKDRSTISTFICEYTVCKPAV